MTDPTLGTEASLNIDSIKELMDGIDPEAILPEMDAIFSKILLGCRIAVMIGPIVLLILGLVYLFLTPKEANHYIGYRTYFGMGSIQAWQFTQRIAGILFTALGVILTIVMLVLSAGFDRMEQMDMVWRAAKCLGWQAGLTLLAVLTINGLTVFWFNRKGELRRRIPKIVQPKEEQ